MPSTITLTIEVRASKRPRADTQLDAVKRAVLGALKTVPQKTRLTEDYRLYDTSLDDFSNVNDPYE